MPQAIEILVAVNPALLRPHPMDAYLKAGMDAAVELVRVAGERNLAGGMVRPTGRPRRRNKPGYGPLAGSLETEVLTPKGAGAAGYIRTRVYYGRFLEKGTAAHVIRRTRPRRALAYPTPAGIFFKHAVKHPGIRPRYWMRSAAESATSGVIGAFETQTRRWADAVFAGGQAAA